MPTTFNMRIEGLDELLANADKVGGELQGKLFNAMNEATALVKGDAQAVKVGRFKNRTGNLRRSINRRVEGPHRGVVSTSEEYGAHVEFGTRPHVIYPKKGRFLVFKNQSGQKVFAKKINHPGSKPYPFMRPAFEDNIGKIQDIYAKIAQEAVVRMAQ